MITRINYRFTAEEPISHFGDQATSNIRRFRRQAIALPEPVEIPSRFKTEQDRRTALVKVLFMIYSRIPSDRKGIKIWTEFEEKLLACAMLRGRHEFLNAFMTSFDCPAIAEPDFIDLIDTFGDDEFMYTIRTEHKLLVARVQAARDHKKAVGNAPKGQSLFEDIHTVENQADSMAGFKKHSEMVPFLSGNSIRGTLRDLAMRDFMNLLDMKAELSAACYHQLFTGGNITDSTAYEDVAKRREYVRNVPMIGLFGSAIGNMTIESQMKVGQGTLVCKENGNGDNSFWELLYTQFGTRLDDSKFMQGVEFKDDANHPTTQMIWFSEEIIKGSQFDHVFVLDTNDEITESAFYRMLYLFMETPYVGGQSARGFGRVSIGFDSDTLASIESGQQAYVDYVKDNAESIKEYLLTI